MNICFILIFINLFFVPLNYTTTLEHHSTYAIQEYSKISNDTTTGNSKLAGSVGISERVFGLVIFLFLIAILITLLYLKIKEIDEKEASM